MAFYNSLFPLALKLWTFHIHKQLQYTLNAKSKLKKLNSFFFFHVPKSRSIDQNQYILFIYSMRKTLNCPLLLGRTVCYAETSTFSLCPQNACLHYGQCWASFRTSTLGNVGGKSNQKACGEDKYICPIQSSETAPLSLNLFMV